MTQLPDTSPGPPLDWGDVSFTTCSYIERRRSPRARLVSKAQRTWPALLALPFGERIFVDDGSPRALALVQLCSTDLHRSFDSLRYNGKRHPRHPNFGIVESLSAAHGRFVVHIDDDVGVDASVLDLQTYLDECLTVLLSDTSILGIALLNQDDVTLDEWRPGPPYEPKRPIDPAVTLAHPNRYFGTAACVLRRDLVERHPLDLVYAAGTDQPQNWEELVSLEPTEFLVNCGASPFAVDRSAWKYRATYRWSPGQAIDYRVRRVKRLLAPVKRAGP